jgi:hypothetical protein
VLASWLARRDSNPRMLGPEPSALPLGDSPSSQETNAESYCELYGIRVTFGDPATSSLKTSFQEKIALQIATGNLHPDPGTRTQCLTAWPIPNDLLILNTYSVKELIQGKG